MVKRIITGGLFLALSAGVTFAQCHGSDREYAGFLGAPKIVRTDTARIVLKGSKVLEEHRHQERVVKFDAAGNMTEQLTGGPYAYHLYTYNSPGERLEKSARSTFITGPPTARDFSTTSPADTVATFFKTVFKCDANGNRIQEDLSESVGGRPFSQLSVTTHQYDGEGHRTSSASRSGEGGFLHRYTFAYKGSIHPTEKSEYNSRGKLIRKEYYTYELDGKGNWTKRVTTTAPNMGNWALANPIEVSYQTITY
jgi:hypothetical protein